MPRLQAMLALTVKTLSLHRSKTSLPTPLNGMTVERAATKSMEIGVAEVGVDGAEEAGEMASAVDVEDIVARIEEKGVRAVATAEDVETESEGADIAEETRRIAVDLVDAAAVGPSVDRTAIMSALNSSSSSRE